VEIDWRRRGGDRLEKKRGDRLEKKKGR